MDLDSGAALARERGVTKGTITKHSGSWNLWLEFLGRVEHRGSPFLDELGPTAQLRLCGAFMHARRRGDLGPATRARQVTAGSARETLDNVATAFVENNRASPILDSRGKVHQHIRRQTSGYKRDDPPKQHQKAMPPIVFRYRLRMAKHARARARAHLLGGAVFFAMRSCEYTSVGKRDRKTRAIEVRDITFMLGNRIIPQTDPRLHLADSVSINFGDQKSEIRNEEVTQYNNDDAEFNPVLHWVETVRRLRSYPGFDPSWEVFKFFDGTSFSKITAREIIVDIRAAVDCIGYKKLGFTGRQVGTHSVRSSFAMMAYLAKEPVYTIMLIGHRALELRCIPTVHRETGQRVHPRRQQTNANQRNFLPRSGIFRADRR